jgi:hypothetical protein
MGTAKSTRLVRVLTKIAKIWNVSLGVTPGAE